ncbi:MAG: stage 0 sporulation family protein [bacterium]
MLEIIGICLPKENKLCYFSINTEKIKLKRGDICVVKTDRGIESGLVAEEAKAIEERGDEGFFPVVRKATPQDLEQLAYNRKREERTFKICQKKINDRDMDMKLITVHYTLDGSKITFYFTAEGRTDFRELVKDLAYAFKTRIELRQIGVRDAAKMFAGFGLCGQPLCCSTFLKRFDSVSIRMAKEQNLILTPSKISGVCGRLMCCLSYEYGDYAKFRKHCPKLGTQIETPEGRGKVVEIDPMRCKCLIQLENERKIDLPVEEPNA